MQNAETIDRPVHWYTMLFNVPDIPVLLLTVAPAAEQMHQAIEIRLWITLLLMEGDLT